MSKTSTSNYFWNLKIPSVSHVLKQLIKVQMKKNWLGKKVAKSVNIYLGYFIYAENYREFPEVTQWAKNHPFRAYQTLTGLV